MSAKIPHGSCAVGARVRYLCTVFPRNAFEARSQRRSVLLQRRFSRANAVHVLRSRTMQLRQLRGDSAVEAAGITLEVWRLRWR